MAKYSFDLKKKIVMAYLKGEGGYGYLAKLYCIPDKKQVKIWVDNYNKYGDDGLMRSRKNEKFSFEYKLHVVELYLSSEISYRELALQEGLTNPAILARWVNDFRIAGPDALRPKKKGPKETLKPRSNQKEIPASADNAPSEYTSAEHVKQLEDELLKLRIENAYLKELRRLRLEEEAPLKRQRGSSTVSGENSN